MSAIGTADADGAFNPMAAAAVAAALALAFVAFIVLLAKAPDLGSPLDPGAHALSGSAVGYRGLTELVHGVGGTARVVRATSSWDSEDLLVVTPDSAEDAEQLGELIERRRVKPTLVILPKWQVARLAAQPAWVERRGLLPRAAIAAILGRMATVTITRYPDAAGSPMVSRELMAAERIAPAELQAVRGDDVFPLIEGPDGSAVLAQIGAAPLFVLADPDIANNHGLASRTNALATLAMLAELNSSGARTIGFDIVLNGFERPPSLLELAFEPPFLAATVCLLAAGLLAGFQAFARFGPPAREIRAVAFGKRALVDNAAGLLRRARREHRAASSYAALTRDIVADATGAPAALGGERLVSYLDRITRDGVRFSEIAADADAVADRPALMANARALYRWRRNLTLDRR